MAYNSLIGDMGNSLSGGQRQSSRARSIGVRKILFLDEATAHLDSAKEREISRVLQDLKITRISIAHRSELAEAADVMLRFEGPDWETFLGEAVARAVGAARDAPEVSPLWPHRIVGQNAIGSCTTIDRSHGPTILPPTERWLRSQGS